MEADTKGDAPVAATPASPPAQTPPKATQAPPYVQTPPEATQASRLREAADPVEPAFAWTLPQRRVLLALLTVLLPILALRFACNPAYVADPQPPYPARFEELADRIDPNTADLPTLAALPLIGEKRAQDIIDFREERGAGSRGRPVFNAVEDLILIRGFGAASVETLRPYLVFPAPSVPPTTQP